MSLETSYKNHLINKPKTEYISFKSGYNSAISDYRLVQEDSKCITCTSRQKCFAQKIIQSKIYSCKLYIKEN